MNAHMPSVKIRSLPDRDGFVQVTVGNFRGVAKQPEIHHKIHQLRDYWLKLHQPRHI